MTIMSTIQDLFSYGNLVHAVSGAAGSITAMTVFFPLDTARFRLQVDDHREAKHSPVVMAEIVKEEGLLALYRGWFPVVSSLCVSNFVYFYTYNGLKNIFMLQGDQQEPGKNLILAAAAGIINVLATTPLWVANTRLKLQGVKFQSDEETRIPKYSGVIDCLIKIIKREGVLALWSGTLPSLVLVANPAVQFMVYEVLKKYFQKLFGTEALSGLMYFIIGAIAKAVSTIATYPLQVIQSRLRAGHLKHQSKNFIHAFAQLIRINGLKGMYKGLEAKLFQTVLMAALMFMTYEKIAAFIFTIMKHQVSPVTA